MAMCSGSLAWASFASGDLASAVLWTAQALRESFARRDLGTTTISLHVGVMVGVLVGRPDGAVRLWGAYDALCDRYGVRPPAGLERFIRSQDPFGLARAALPPERFEIEYALGQRMTLGEAVDFATDLASDVSSLPGGGAAAGPPPDLRD